MNVSLERKRYKTLYIAFVAIGSVAAKQALGQSLQS